MTFKLLKRRYRSSDENEAMRRLQYFNQPYEPGNEIRIMRDVHLSKPLMVQSLSSQLVSFEDTKRGKKNATQRDNATTTASADGELDYYEDLEFEPFDTGKSVNY